MKGFSTTVVASLIFLCATQVVAQTDQAASEILRLGPAAPTPPCSQSKSERDALIRQAEKMRFTIRRVEFVGTTYTRDEVLRGRMINFQEGDFFTRSNLIKSLTTMSKLRNEIYPVKLSDVELRLNESEKTVDMEICFKPKRL